MSIEKELLHMELQQHEKDFLHYSAILIICSAGIDVLSEKYPDDLEIAYGTLGAIKFIKEKSDEAFKAVQSSRELLEMESLPDDITKEENLRLKKRELQFLENTYYNYIISNSRLFSLDEEEILVEKIEELKKDIDALNNL